LLDHDSRALLKAGQQPAANAKFIVEAHLIRGT
jgi:hypothetical protein